MRTGANRKMRMYKTSILPFSSFIVRNATQGPCISKVFERFFPERSLTAHRHIANRITRQALSNMAVDLADPEISHIVEPDGPTNIPLLFGRGFTLWIFHSKEDRK
jgi:hypothetical protein